MAIRRPAGWHISGPGSLDSRISHLAVDNDECEPSKRITCRKGQRVLLCTVQQPGVIDAGRVGQFIEDRIDECRRRSCRQGPFELDGEAGLLKSFSRELQGIECCHLAASSDHAEREHDKGGPDHGGQVEDKGAPDRANALGSHFANSKRSHSHADRDLSSEPNHPGCLLTRDHAPRTDRARPAPATSVRATTVAVCARPIAD